MILVDRPTVRQQTEYYALAAQGPTKDLFIRYWDAAQALIAEWECAAIPDRSKLDVDAETNPNVTAIMIWVGLEVKRHVDALETIPKN